VKILLRGVNTVRKRLADGSVRIHYYHRPTGQKLPPDPTSPEFVARLQELNRPVSAAVIDPRSIAALIITYKSSPEFKQLAPASAKKYSASLERLRDAWGTLPARGIQRHHVLALRDKYAETPAGANHLVQVLSLLLSFAVDRNWLKDNPAQRLKRLKTGDGHRPWEEWELEKFREHWPAGTEERLALELLVNTGQRGGDVNAMVRTHYRAGFISVVQEKTGARLEIPVTIDLRNVLDPWLAEHPNNLLLLPGKLGKGRGIDALRHWLSQAAIDAGVDGVTIHGLRYTAATRLAELGLDWQSIADITGHQTMAMALKYSEKRRRSTLSIARLDAATARQNSRRTERDGNDRS
jgi:integrase